MEVISLLGHELIHAINHCRSGHGQAFQQLSRALKCIHHLQVPMNKWRETLTRFRAIAQQLGHYPRAGALSSESFNFASKHAVKEMADV